jgi:DNA-binding transcriptional regulator GbsR (MarR family)
MANPFLTVPFVQHQLKTSTQGAVNLVKQIESFGWVRKIEIRGPRGRYFWVADEVLDIVEDIDLSYPASAGELVEATGSSVEELPFV